MRYWWVNQNQTFRHELAGGYLWSPKRKSDGRIQPYYEFMREVAPGDLIFSFVDTYIKAFSIALSPAYEAPKPIAFESAGRYWNNVGWRVDVRYSVVATALRPADWMQLLGPLLPRRYSPLQANGKGLQSIYLTELSEPLALALADLLGNVVAALARSSTVADQEIAVPSSESVLWEDYLRKTIDSDPTLDETSREALIVARRGQGLFRERVQRIEWRCRVTGVDRPEHLRASHCKPWRDSSNDERLSGENGLLLTPSIDHLFDRGFISFEGTGRLLVSPVAHEASLRRMGVPQELNTGPFAPGQRSFLEYHRDEVFLRARVRGQAWRRER